MFLFTLSTADLDVNENTKGDEQERDENACGDFAF